MPHAANPGSPPTCAANQTVDRRDAAGMAFTCNRPVGKLLAARIVDLQVGRRPNAFDLAMSVCGKDRSAKVSKTENLMLDDPALMTSTGSRMGVTRF